jgi:membrane protein
MKDSYFKIYRDIEEFLSRGVWREDLRELPTLKSILYKTARFSEHVLRSFTEDHCLLRASALTYTSLLSLVPLLALMFAILKGLGVQRRLEPFLVEKFTIGSEELAAKIMEYIDRTNVSSLGVVGVVTLVITSVLVLRNVERSFNWIWKVKKGRSWTRVVSDYLSVLMITPICILLALSLTTYFSSDSFARWMETHWLMGGMLRFLIKASPYAVMWIAFAVFYLFMPNTRVNVASALAGGVVGGTLWQLTQWGYIRYQFGMGQYNAIYGALSQLPILLVWIYVSWVIVLFGAEIAFAHENLARYTEKKALAFQKWEPPAAEALRVLKAVGDRFLHGGNPLTVEELGRELSIPRSRLESRLRRLEELGWIAPWSEGSSPVFFRCPPDRMPLHEVLKLAPEKHGTQPNDAVSEVLHRADTGMKESLGDLTVQDLLAATKSGSPHQETQGQGQEAQR